MNNLPTVAAQPAALLPVNSVQDLQTLGAILAQSNLFGKRNPAEGLAIVGMCHQKRISWLDFMQNFHMIQGVVSKKTDAILADFHRAGGSHRVLSRTSDKAEATFTLGEATYTSTVTWEDCLAEPFVYNGKESDVLAMLERGQKPPLKAKYSTPRARMQMLWARCVSDGVRVVAPECCQGVYTPEETADFVEPPAAQPLSFQPSTSDQTVCPCGMFTGKPWASLDTPVLQQALNGTSPLITPEMKDHIRTVLHDRETTATQPATDNLQPETIDAEVVHA